MSVFVFVRERDHCPQVVGKDGETPTPKPEVGIKFASLFYTHCIVGPMMMMMMMVMMVMVLYVICRTPSQSLVPPH